MNEEYKQDDLGSRCRGEARATVQQCNSAVAATWHFVALSGSCDAQVSEASPLRDCARTNALRYIGLVHANTSKQRTGSTNTTSLGHQSQSWGAPREAERERRGASQFLFTSF